MDIEAENNESNQKDQEGGAMNQEDIDAMLSGRSAAPTDQENAVSQDEIDAMMGFGGGTAIHEASTDADDRHNPSSAPSGAASAERYGVTSLDLLNQDRVTRSRMPTMEVLNDRFARSFRASLFNYLRVNADILPISAQLQKYGDYIGRIALPSYFVMVSMAPLRGSMLFVMDPYLCYAVIEAFFGGNGKLEPKLEGRDFSIIEQRVFNNIIEHAVADFSAAWEPIVKFRMKIFRADMKAQFVSIAAGPETIVGSAFDIEMERWKGRLYICFPYNSVEPFREQLVSGVAADQSEMDPTWKTALHKDVQNAQVDVSVLLATKDIPLHQARTLRVGDVLSFERTEDARVYVENILIGEGKYGVSRNHYAIRLNRYRSLNEEDILKALHLKREGINDAE
jgi:flagellar motor switch protein FliM